jgi:8-oxo-dGTP diphosphatase
MGISIRHRWRGIFSACNAPPFVILLLVQRHLTILLYAASALVAVGAFSSINMPQPSYIDKLALILIRNRQQLVARTRGKSVFFTPGGKREGNESDIAALCRECREELTIQLDESTIQKYDVFEAQAFGKPPGTMVRMTCYQADSYHGTLTANEEVEELKWIDSTFSRDQLSVTGIMILEDLKANNLID